MSTLTAVEKPVPAIQERVEQLKDQVIRSFWKKGGRACVADLANELSPPTSAKELVPIVESLEEEGIVRRVSDPKDHRDYQAPHQTIYELSR